MAQLIQKYLQLVLLRITPQELPGQPIALWISVAAAFIASLAGLLFAYRFGDAVLRSVLAILVPGVLVYAMLGVKNLQSRFVQSYSALCGSAAVIYIIALPLLPAFFSAAADSSSGKLIIFIVLLLDIWTLLITAHIFKHAFEVGFASAISLAVVMMIVTLLTIETLAPTPQVEHSAPTADTQNVQMAMMIWRGLYRSG